MTVLTIIWVMLIVALTITGALFLIGAMSIGRITEDEERRCICKQTRWAIYADINCPIHGNGVSDDLKG